MKANKNSAAQKAFNLKSGEEVTPVADVCRKAWISYATYFECKKMNAELLPDEMGRVRKLAKDLTLDREMQRAVIHWKV